tara:strand:- start:506 stop:757 length:252 start_codon:yes stop_codon:yes gene_type:complete
MLAATTAQTMASAPRFDEDPDEDPPVVLVTHQRKMAGAAGFEPAVAIPKTAALPLGYAPISQALEGDRNQRLASPDNISSTLC